MELPFSKYIKPYDLILETLLNSSEGLTDAQLNWKPSDSSWSVAQVHAHLLMSEKLSIKYLQKKLPHASDSKKAGLKSWWNFIRLKWALKGPFSLKAPVHVASVPDYLTKEELLVDWNSTRVKMKSLLESIPKEFAGNNLYRHPLTGKFSIAHMLQFFVIHIGGHIQQIARIKAHPNFPNV